MVVKGEADGLIAAGTTTTVAVKMLKGTLTLSYTHYHVLISYSYCKRRNLFILIIPITLYQETVEYYEIRCRL